MAIDIQNIDYSGVTMTVTVGGTAAEKARLKTYFSGSATVDGSPVKPEKPYDTKEAGLFTSSELQIKLSDVPKHFKLKRSSRYCETPQSLALEDFFEELDNVPPEAHAKTGPSLRFGPGPGMGDVDYSLVNVRGGVKAGEQGDWLPVIELRPVARNIDASMAEVVLEHAAGQVQAHAYQFTSNLTRFLPAALAAHGHIYPKTDSGLDSRELMSNQPPSQQHLVAKVSFSNIAFPGTDKNQAQIFAGQLANDINRQFSMPVGNLSP